MSFSPRQGDIDIFKQPRNDQTLLFTWTFRNGGPGFEVDNVLLIYFCHMRYTYFRKGPYPQNWRFSSELFVLNVIFWIEWCSCGMNICMVQHVTSEDMEISSWVFFRVLSLCKLWQTILWQRDEITYSVHVTTCWQICYKPVLNTCCWQAVGFYGLYSFRLSCILLFDLLLHARIHVTSETFNGENNTHDWHTSILIDSFVFHLSHNYSVDLFHWR